jgi:hypothetical protein
MCNYGCAWVIFTHRDISVGADYFFARTHTLACKSEMSIGLT